MRAVLSEREALDTVICDQFHRNSLCCVMVSPVTAIYTDTIERG